MSQESPHTHYGRRNRAHKTPCEAMAARQIEEGLRGGDYDSEELVRWYWSLDKIMGLTWNEAPPDDAYDQARRLHHRVMRAMSATLPARRVALARVNTLARVNFRNDPELDHEWIARLCREETYGDHPIVVQTGLPDGWLMVMDGTHRVTAAREDGETHLNAVVVS